MKWYFCTEMLFRPWHHQLIGNAHAPQISIWLTWLAFMMLKQQIV